MEGILARGLQVLIALAGAYVVALWFVLVVWTFRDIESRSRSIVTQVFSTLLVVLFFVPGILLYLILRPKATLDEAFQRSLEEEYLLQDLEELPLCHQCQRYVEDDFVLCPHCRAQLREPCQSCSRLVHLRWSLCPYCAAPQDGRAAEEAARVEAPAARWTAPALRRRIRAVPDSALPEPIEPFVALATVDEDGAPDEERAAIVTTDDERDETVAAAAARPTPTRVHTLERAARRLDDAEPADLEEDDDEPARARLSVFHRARELGRAFTANGNGHSVAENGGANGTAPKTNGHRNGNGSGHGVANGRDLSVLERLRLSALAEPHPSANGKSEPSEDEDAEAEPTYVRSRAEGD